MVSSVHENHSDLILDLEEWPSFQELGMLPLSMIANAGTVNSGAIDNCPALGKQSNDKGLWLHVDGAIDDLAVMPDNLHPLFKGIEQTDSPALDLHNWLYVPYEVGCVLVRDGHPHRQSFAAVVSYLETPTRDNGAMADPINGRGPQFSPGFKASKVWVLIRTYGLEHLGGLRDHNAIHIQSLVSLIDASEQLEPLAPMSLNIRCYYLPIRLPVTMPDELNQELLVPLLEDGIAVPSSTRIHGYCALRVANTNHSRCCQNFDLLVKESVCPGWELEATWFD